MKINRGMRNVGSMATPRRFIDVIDRSVASHPGKGCIGGWAGQRDAVEDFLERPQAAGDPEHGGTKGLQEGAAGARQARHCAEPRAEPRPVAGVLLGGQGRLDALATGQAVRLRQHPRGDVQVDGRQCKDLGCRGRRGRSKGRVAATTRWGH